METFDRNEWILRLSHINFQRTANSQGHKWEWNVCGVCGDGGCYCNTGLAESKARSRGGLEEWEHLRKGQGKSWGSSNRMYNDYHTEAVGHQLFQHRNDVEEEFWAVDSFLGVAASFVSFLERDLEGRRKLVSREYTWLWKAQGNNEENNLSPQHIFR